MKSLELKIPPVVVFALSAILMWLISLTTNTLGVDGKFRFVFGSISALAGGFIAISGIICFKKANTTFNPTKPDQARSLVHIGIYKYTRNPMYVGLLFGLFTWACFLNNLFSFIFIFAFLVYMTRFQIKPEEKALESLFGEEYKLYKKEARRWL